MISEPHSLIHCTIIGLQAASTATFTLLKLTTTSLLQPTHSRLTTRSPVCLAFLCDQWKWTAARLRQMAISHEHGNKWYSNKNYA